MKEIKYYCDICKKEIKEDRVNLSLRSIYDLCNECVSVIELEITNLMNQAEIGRKMEEY